jgi:hypothetical protein
MDPFHERLARIALDEAGAFGFARAGGYAVQAHGFLKRFSSDIDLFAEASADFNVDVDAILISGRYTEDQLLGLASDFDAGFDHVRFAEALAAIDRLPDSLFRPYGLSPEGTSALRERMRAWVRRISSTT